MRVKLIGVSHKTRKSESVNRAKYDYCSAINASPLIVDAKFLRSTYPVIWQTCREVGALRRHIGPIGCAALAAHRAIWYGRDRHRFPFLFALSALKLTRHASFRIELSRCMLN